MDDSALLRITTRTRLKTLVVNICDHCNLNCAGCDHFSPIAEENFYSPEVVLRDVYRIKELLDNNINLISVMGGEPLLHPGLIDILSGIRKQFSDIDIWLSTNGLLLIQMDDSFWKALKENHITINVTKYPINTDYKRIEELAAKENVAFSYYHGGIEEKTMGHYPLDITGSQDSCESFINCFHANNTCNMLQKGKLYTCTVAPCIPIFNKRYGLNIPLTEDDGIDIYAISDKRELFRRLAEPMPICRFCDVKRRTFGHKWSQSTGDISEWT